MQNLGPNDKASLATYKIVYGHLLLKWSLFNDFPVYHDSDVWDDFYKDELAPEDVERHVDGVQPHRGADDLRAVRFRILLKIASHFKLLTLSS